MEARGKRDERKPGDERDERDEREPGDPRDKRDVRQRGDRGDWIPARARLLLIAGFLVLWVGPSAALFVYADKIDTNAKRIAQNNKTLRTSQLRGCHRLNIVRAEDNRSQLKDFEVFRATIALLSKAALHPTTPLSAQQKRENAAYIAGIRADVLSKEWTPLTKCYAATFHPATYVTPLPRPFAVFPAHGKPILTLPPPSALVVGEGE